jgi:tetratricopeptide (TPR) repeat protein
MAFGYALTLTAALLVQAEAVAQDDGRYLRLVNLYRGGHPEEAIRELRSLDAAVVKGFIRRRAPGVDDHGLQAASLLETELAMTLAERSRWEEADAHFVAAWQISFLIEMPLHRLSFQRDWLLAVGLFHHQLIFVNVNAVEEAFVRADRFLHNAVRLYANDPDVLLAAGSVLEWSGSLREGEPAHLKEAEELYARALRFAPDEPEILLRHGLVLEKLEKEDEAAPPLRRVLELGARKDLTYRSRMVLGRMAERAGRLAEAIAHYEAAADAIPSWQVAYVALGHALHASGAHDRAREALDHALAMDMKSADATLGGWWSYELGVALRFEPLFEGMRAEVTQ